MREVYGDLWRFPADYRIITTNGTVRMDVKAVMGRGCAREAAVRFPHLAGELGGRIRRSGNHVYWFRDYQLVTFPVKHAWYETASLELIERSVRELLNLINDIALHEERDRTFVLPRPGCGNGGLKYDAVRPLLLALPNTVSVIAYKGQELK